MTAESVGEVPGGLRAIDRQLLGLEPDPAEPGVLWFDLSPTCAARTGGSTAARLSPWRWRRARP